MKRLFVLVLVSLLAASAHAELLNGGGGGGGGGTVTIANGGTNATTATAAFNNLSPCLIQGDISYYNGTNWVCLGVGTSGQVLQTQGASANPQWVNISGTPAVKTTTYTVAASDVNNLLVFK